MPITRRPAQSEEPARAACWVVAIVKPDAVARVRAALSDVPLLAVALTHGTSWQNGRELSYRGVRFQADEAVVRVEVACDERHVDRITSALSALLQQRGESQVERIDARPATVFPGGVLALRDFPQR